MTRKLTKFVLMGMLLALLIGLLPAAGAQAPNLSRIRIAHLSPDAPAVDIYVNGAASGIQTLAFQDISGWVELPAGTYRVAVVPAGAPIDQAAIGPVSLNLPANGWTTVAAIGSLANGSLRPAVYREDVSRLAADQARVTVFHGIEDAPAVDVMLADGTKLVRNLAFGQGRTITVPAGTYDLQVVPAGATSPVVINLAGTTLDAQKFYFVAASNRLAAPQVALSVVSLSQISPLIDKFASTRSIAEIAASDGRFSTLVTALQAADLVDVLAGPGNFTVFAPTNAAFAKLPAGTLQAVLADKNLLTTILKYHVLGGKALASDVVGLTSFNPLDGGSVRVEVRDGKVFLNDNIQIILTDIQANNGVIHVIDGVLVP